MVEPATYNLMIYKYATYSLPITWKDETGAVYDLHEYTAKMQIRTTINADTPTITLSTETGEISLASESPNIVLNIDAEDTGKLPNMTNGVYDLDLTNPITGIVTRLIQGKVNISPAVTRPN